MNQFDYPDWVLDLPQPTPDRHAYQEELEKALDFSEARRANYEQYKRSLRREVVEYLPVKMDFENVSRCNYRCSKCQLSTWDHGKRARDMTVAEFKGLIDALYSLVEIKIQGMGEPLLAPDELFEMIRYARKQHIWVRTTTNASLLHVRDNYKRLVDADPNEIQISVDGATKETFETIRKGGKFERVVENCRLINAYCNDHGLLKTRMWACLEKVNCYEIVELVRLASQLGFKRVSFSLDLHGWGIRELEAKAQKRLAHHILDEDLVKEAIRLGEEMDIDVSFWANTNTYSTLCPEQVCPWPFSRAYISSDMRIVPCCMIGDPSTAELGDAANFIEEWHKETYRQFRKMHLEGEIPSYCRSCYGL